MTVYESAQMTESLNANSPEQAVRRILESWTNGNPSDAIDLFADSFTFADHGIDLTFCDKQRLLEYFQKVEQLFPGSALRVDSAHSCGGNVTVEWTWTATRSEPSLGAVRREFPVRAQGVSVVQVECGKVRRWTDYYDSRKSYRFPLADFFSEWVEP